MQMATFTKEIGLKIKQMGMAFTSTIMEQDIKDKYLSGE